MADVETIVTQLVRPHVQQLVRLLARVILVSRNARDTVVALLVLLAVNWLVKIGVLVVKTIVVPLIVKADVTDALVLAAMPVHLGVITAVKVVGVATVAVAVVLAVVVNVVTIVIWDARLIVTLHVIPLLVEVVADVADVPAVVTTAVLVVADHLCVRTIVVLLIVKAIVLVVKETVLTVVLVPPIQE